MFGSDVLDIAIGLAFLYLLAGLICSTLNEFISGVLAWRAQTLEQGLRNLLDGDVTTKKDGWAAKLLDHPLVDALGKGDSTPSYLPAPVFSSALLEMILGAGNNLEGAVQDLNLLKGKQVFDMLRSKVQTLNNPVLRGALPALIESARNQWTGTDSEITVIKKEFESWFNDAMNRVSGWYKRKSQISILFLSFLGVAVLNIDTLKIGRRLGSDSTFRSQITTKAADYIADPAPPLQRLDAAQYPIGWGSDWDYLKNADGPDRIAFLLQKLIGLLSSVAAISLGAPFWFDVLSRFISIRASGKPVGAKPNSA